MYSGHSNNNNRVTHIYSNNSTELWFHKVRSRCIQRKSNNLAFSLYRWYKSGGRYVLTSLIMIPRLKWQLWSTTDTFQIQKTMVCFSHPLPRLACSTSSMCSERKHLIVWYFMFCFPIRSLLLFPSLTNPLFSATHVFTSKRHYIFNAFGYLTLVLFQYILLHFLLAQDFGSSNLLTHWLPHRLHVCMT